MNVNVQQKNAFGMISCPTRPSKPRVHGLTMVLDKNLTVAQTEEFVGLASEFVDLVKLGWGTSVIFDRDHIIQKCEVLADAGIRVCPGGTLAELAFLQKVFPEFLKEAAELKFSCVEISDGTVSMTHKEKRELIKQAIDAGFTVVSEVGSKVVEEDSRLDAEYRIETTMSELEAGVWKVIFEARESGTLGIFDSKGKTQFSLLEKLLEHVDSEQIIFEAPQKSQQADLIKLLGPNVNLGNIPPSEVIPLETLRRGFRGDTLRHFHLSMPRLSMELGPPGALAASERGDVIIMVDALRASSTIVTALANGVRSVRAVTSVNECVGDLTAGERGGKKIPSLDLDNSPISFKDGSYSGRELVLTTTNGTECLVSAAANPKAVVLVGSLLNVSAVTSYALELAKSTKRNISVIIAGRNNQAVDEDVLVAAEIAYLLPGAPLSTDISLPLSEDPVGDFLRSHSGVNLSRIGRSEDVVWCAQKDIYAIVPQFDKGLVEICNQQEGQASK